MIFIADTVDLAFDGAEYHFLHTVPFRRRIEIADQRRGLAWHHLRTAQHPHILPITMPNENGDNNQLALIEAPFNPRNLDLANEIGIQEITADEQYRDVCLFD